MSPESGASSTPPVKLTVASAVVKPDVNVVPTPVVPHVESLAGWSVQ